MPSRSATYSGSANIITCIIAIPATPRRFNSARCCAISRGSSAARAYERRVSRAGDRIEQRADADAVRIVIERDELPRRIDTHAPTPSSGQRASIRAAQFAQRMSGTSRSSS